MFGSDLCHVGNGGRASGVADGRFRDDTVWDARRACSVEVFVCCCGFTAPFCGTVSCSHSSSTLGTRGDMARRNML
jgi:hypothetical protein